MSDLRYMEMVGGHANWDEPMPLNSLQIANKQIKRNSVTSTGKLSVFQYETGANVVTLPQVMKAIYRRATRPIRHMFQAPRFYHEVVTGLNITEEVLAQLDELDADDEIEKGEESDNRIPTSLEDAGSLPVSNVPEGELALALCNYRHDAPPLTEPPAAKLSKSARKRLCRKAKQKKYRNVLMLEIACEVKAKFGGTPERTAANDQVAREYMYRVMARIKDLRAVDMELMAPRVLANIFCPSQNELKTEIMMHKSGINQRNAVLHQYRPKRN